MKVLWLTFIPSPYRLRFFEELGKQCELTVLFERESSRNRKTHWDNFRFNGYTGIVLKGVTVGRFDRFCPSVVRYLVNDYDHIVISNPTSPTGILAATVLQIKRIPYLVESDGAFPTGRKGVKLKIKRFVMSHATLCLSTARLHDEYYRECGVKPENIRRYTFTSIGVEDLIEAKKLTAKDKAYYKNKLGITESFMVLSIGRFSYDNGYGKGFDLLMETADVMRDRDVGFYIVGDEPTAEFSKAKQDKGLDFVHFIDYKEKEALAEYYAAADIFILLTRGDVWGLVINEAMTFGLPIISSNKCIAGLELIQDNENGFIVSLDKVDVISDRIIALMADPSLRDYMSKNNIFKASEYTFQKMANQHITIFESVR